jgi:carboxypeptidase Taq
MKKKPKAFTALKELSTKIHTYQSILSLLHWDQETYMPEGSITPRSEQISVLATLIHEEKTGRSFQNLLEKIVHLPSGKPKIKGLSKEDLAIVHHWHKEFSRTTKLSPSFVKTFSQVTSEASQIWSIAKKNNNFKLFAPFLKKIVDLSREKAHIIGFSHHPYDALLEAYEPCMTTNKLSVLFGNLKKELVSLLKKISQAKPINQDFLHAEIDHETQMAISQTLLAQLPMEKEYSRLDLSSHPFSTALHPHDSRITTRILPNAFMSNIFSILHEAGHSMYEMGLPLQHFGTPLCEAASLSVHESQSRFWETLIGRSLPFWKGFYPKLKQHLPKQLKNVPLETFYKAINAVAPSFVRVEADEVTYCLHVILRFEIEKELINGTLQVDDLPEKWNHLMQEIFGIKPSSDTMGCLQDIHWSLGDFGYFPTYALGNLLAAHFFSSFAKDHPDWEEQIGLGDLSFVRNWLKKNIHNFGKMYDAEQLAKKIGGKPLSEKAYCSYLKRKYAQIYGNV